jgi:hypothetical protein
MNQEITLKEIIKKAEEIWTPCHGCDEYDKQFWINGFISGYLIGQDNTQIVANSLPLEKTEGDEDNF